MMKLASLKRFGLFLSVLVVFMAGIVYGTVVVSQQPYCKVLIAGQNIDAGEVCLEVVGNNLVVTYSTTGDWELTEAHLWVGDSTSDMPQTNKGNPKVGNFPYHSGDITGETEFEFSIPLSELYESNMDELCGVTFFAAAHASLRKPDGSGGYQTETGWASGDPIVTQGNWATYFNFTFECPGTPPPPGLECETAFAYGDKTFQEINDPDTGVPPLSMRWGWQITVNAGDTFPQYRDIWAGAGQNDTSKGTLVGYLEIDYDGSTLTVNFVMNAPFTMEETHLYAAAVETDTVAPGQFNIQPHHENLGGSTFETYQIQISGGPIYIVAHAVVCQPEN